MIRLATQEDLNIIEQSAPFLTHAVLADKVEREEVYVADCDGKLVGFAHYNYFCDIDPFLTFIFILSAHRRKGFGTQLMDYWEQQMKEKGHRCLYTSTQADEEAQFFYRKLGFSDTGAFLFPGQEASELLLLKRLREGKIGTGPREIDR